MHVLMLVAALSLNAEVTIDPSTLTEPASQLEVVLFAGETRVLPQGAKSPLFRGEAKFTLKPGKYRLRSDDTQLDFGAFVVAGDAVSEVAAPLRASNNSLSIDRSKLTSVHVDASSLASGADLVFRVIAKEGVSTAVTKSFTCFLPFGEFRVTSYGATSTFGAFSINADGVKSKSAGLIVTPRGIAFEPTKFTRVDFVIDELSSGAAKQVFSVRDGKGSNMVTLDDNATVFFADDSLQFTRVGATKPLGTFSTNHMNVSGSLQWDEATHTLRVDRKSLDRVAFDFTAFQRGMGAVDALYLSDSPSLEHGVKFTGVGSAWLQRGSYNVVGGELTPVLGSFATSPAPTVNGGVTWTITADVTQLVPLKLTSKREFHVAPFTRSRSTWQLQLPRGRYALRAADGRALTTLIVEPPRASLENTSTGVTLDF